VTWPGKIPRAIAGCRAINCTVNRAGASLTPWRGEWYWSGAQRQWDNLSPEEQAELRKNMLERNSAITYRYCPERAAMARERV